jgi:Zinc carboxypeptidase
MTPRSRSLARALATLLPLLVLSSTPAAQAQRAALAEPQSIPAEWLTVAEASDFRATSSYDQTIAFLRRLEGRLPALHLDFYGTSGEGRPLPVVVVAADRAFTPEAAAAAGRPVVMIQNGIHGGEIDGKDACLMLLRDLALGRRPELLAAATLLVVPIYNVDGHERVSPFNRPNQNGPVEGMGFRTNAAGLDLNRDNLKLVSPEARALIGLVNRWRPHLHVDDHVTDGVDHDWVLTWAWAEAPEAPPTVDAWLAAHLPRVVAATAAAGHRTGPYVDLLDRADPAKGFTSRVAEPRYATGYFPLRNRPSILVETHSYKPYRERVLANRDFLAALLAEVGRDPRSLLDAVAAAEARTVALGRPAAPPSDVALTYAPAPPDRIRLPVYAWSLTPSEVMGRPILTYRRGEVREIEVDWVHRSVVAKAVARPRGYLLRPGWPEIEARLAGHGLAVRRLTRPVELTAETLRVSDPVYAPAPYQGLTAVTARVERRAEAVAMPAGALWVPADQPDFQVAVQLLEPEAPDSLFAWGMLSTVLERKEYIEPRVLEGLARDLLADPAVAAEWRAALADPAFAADPQARWLWWYRRTPSWDDRFGLLPFVRVTAGGLPAVAAALDESGR